MHIKPMHIKNDQSITYSPIGIDIGTRSINVTQLATTSEGLHIYEADIMMLPEEGFSEKDILIDALYEIKKRSNFRGKDVVSRMPPSLVSIVPIKVSMRESETVEQAILRESKEYIPYPVEDAVIDYLPISKTSEGGDETKKVLLIFTKKSDVVTYLDILKKTGFKVKAIDIGPNAINRAINRFRKPSERRILVINIGDMSSFSTILWDDMILIDRKMGWGEHNIMDKIVSNLDLDISEARKVMYRYGIDWSSISDIGPDISLDESTWVMSDESIPAHLYEIVTPALEDLNREIEKMLIYCTSEMKGAMIDQIYLMGSGGFIRHLNQYLHKTFGIGVKPFEPEDLLNPAAPLKGIIKDNFPIFIVSIGLALRGCNA